MPTRSPCVPTGTVRAADGAVHAAPESGRRRVRADTTRVGGSQPVHRGRGSRNLRLSPGVTEGERLMVLRRVWRKILDRLTGGSVRTPAARSRRVRPRLEGLE